MESWSSCADVNCHRLSFISSVSTSERAAHQTRWWSLHLLSGCRDIQRQEQRMSSWKKRRCSLWFLYIWLSYLDSVSTFKFTRTYYSPSATRSRFCNTFTLSESFKRPKIQTGWLMRPKIIFNLKFEVLPATQNTKDTEFPSILPVLVYSGVPSRQQAKRGLTSFWRHFRKFDCSFRVGGDFYHTSPNKRSSSVMRQTP